MSHNCRNLIFSLTTGRSGTAFLAELLRANLLDAEIYHERTGFDLFGVETPDLSHLTLFNSQGNVPKVKAFWSEKFSRICETDLRYYVETSHILMKAGLVENIGQISGDYTVHFIVLTRSIVDTMVSYRCRMDFVNRGNMWLWYLDPQYPRKIVDFRPFSALGWEGVALWYICEIRTRTEYYRLLLADEYGIQFHEIELEQLNHPDEVSRLLRGLGQDSAAEVTIPPPANQNAAVRGKDDYRLSIQRLVEEGVDFNPRTIAEEFFRSGRRLGEPTQ